MKGKNSLPRLKYVLSLSCVVHRPIYGRFMGCNVNGLISLYKSARGLHRRDVTHMLSKVSDFLLKSGPFFFVGYRNDRFFSHANPYISALFPMLRNNADAHIWRLGYLWFYRNTSSKQ